MSNKVTIFSEMSALAKAERAVNLSQGFPDFELDKRLGAYLKEAFDANFNQYAPMPGLPILLESISNRILTKYNQSFSTELITITPGATYGIYTALAAIIQPMDEVIILEPAYDSYAQNISSLGGVVVGVPLRKENFSVDWSKVQEAISDKTKAIIINTPHNPTGQVWDASDFETLKELVRNTEINIISDEVYEYLTFDGKKHFSILEDDELFERSFVIYSFGKVLQATGWKIGYVIAPLKHTSLFRQKHQYIGFSVNSISQYAIAKFQNEAHEELNLISKQFQDKRDLMLKEFQKLPFQVPFKSRGSYFQLFSFKGLSDQSDRQYAKELAVKAKVASIPLSPFYQNETNTQTLRFCFAKNNETIEDAAKRLGAYFDQ